MSMIHRSLVASLTALLLAILAPAASAAPLAIASFSGDDSPAFGMSLTVWNDSALFPELAGGDAFEQLTLQLFDSNLSAITTYSLDSLAVDDVWFTPGFGDVTTAFGDVRSVTLSLVFRGQALVASLRTCQPGDNGDGCFVDILVPLDPVVDPDCLVESPTCELIGRTAAADVEFAPPGVPEPAVSVLVAVALLGAVRRARASASRA